jgi:hypothetical protein
MIAKYTGRLDLHSRKKGTVKKTGLSDSKTADFWRNAAIVS